MEFAPSGISLSFEVSFDSPGLPVAMSVYDDTGASPVLIQGPSAMLNFVGSTYRGKFLGTTGKQYLIFKAVYTDGTFATLDPNYLPGSESFSCADILGPLSLIGAPSTNGLAIRIGQSESCGGCLEPVFVGDAFTGSIQLLDGNQCCDGGLAIPFVIPSSAQIDIHFPPADPSVPVVLSTLGSGEVMIADANLSIITFNGSPAKSAMLKVGNKQPISLVLTPPGGTPNTAQVLKVFTVMATINP